jgi:uncharacterized protein with FMN-binding domain
MRKNTFPGLIWLLPLLLAACASTQAVSNIVANTYPAVASGYGGDFEVSVSLSDDTILDIIVGKNDETPGLGDKAIETMRNEMLAANTAGVDTVAGATVTSEAFKAAVIDALREAGAPLSMIRPARPAQ